MEDDTVLHSFGKHKKKSLFQILEESMQDEHNAEVKSWNPGSNWNPWWSSEGACTNVYNVSTTLLTVRTAAS